ncbi:D-alanyl-D-alanine carboxypeptidase family protein [Populibacterium corticicola]|uniref:D-alanyl-D-alanine carboxypeptidase family protein n=1 Tax=Populibacterium corticicola TaxID=1812826 RepID=A0ABW5XDQ7_9MICO
MIISMAAHGKRIATSIEAAHAPDTDATRRGRYQGRRAAQKRNGIRLALFSVPSIAKPVLGKPVIAASVAIAGLVGTTVVVNAHDSRPNTSQVTGEERNLTDLVEPDTAITIASSEADEAVMKAAELLNNASALIESDAAVQKAAAELEQLLEQIALEAEEIPTREGSGTASRSFSRNTLATDVEQASGTASAEGLYDSEESLEITIRAVGAYTDVPVAQAEKAAANPEVEQAINAAPEVVQTASVAPYIGKHAATEQSKADGSSQSMVVYMPGDDTFGDPATDSTANVVDVPTGADTVSVAVTDTTIDSVVAATARLQALVDGTSTPGVTTAEELAVLALEAAWAEAVELANSYGTFSNGRLPDSALVEIATATGQKARPDAALMFAELNAAFKEEFGRDIQITDSYRSYSSQVTTKAAKGWLAAPPGMSNHGWGLALDLNGPEARWNTPERNWLVANSTTYGWFSPEWAQKTKPEPWHWEFGGAEVSPVARAMGY